MRNGEIFAKPYATSAKPFRRDDPTAVIYGAVDTIQNPPKLFTKSVSASAYSAKMAMTAGTVKKQPEPYVRETGGRVANQADDDMFGEGGREVERGWSRSGGVRLKCVVCAEAHCGAEPVEGRVSSLASSFRVTG